MEIMYNKGYQKEMRFHLNRLHKMTAMKKFEGKFTFAIAHSHVFKWRDEMKKVGIYGDKIDEGLIIDDISGRPPVKYVMEGTFGATNLEEFLDDFLSGKLQSYRMSEPVPAENNGYVKIVTGKTFDQIVKDPTKEVLLLLYHPSDQKWKSFESKWEQIGKQLSMQATKEHVTVAKMNFYNNAVPPLYRCTQTTDPCIVLVPSTRKNSPVFYKGELKDLREIIKWAKANASVWPEDYKEEL